jgi:hypothetical protein
MAEWVRAAEVQLETHRWLTSPAGVRWQRGWIAAEMRNEPAKGEVYALLAQAEPQKLLTADAIWVAEEMGEVIDFARETFKAEPMEREDFIVHTGFLYFQKPLLMLDRNSKNVSVGAISWCPVRFTNKTQAEVYAEASPALVGLDIDGHGTEATFHDSEVEEDQWGMALTIYSSARAEGDDYHQTHVNMQATLGSGELSPLHYTYVMFGSPLDDGDMYDEHEVYTAADHWWKLIQTTLRLMQQRVFEQIETPIPRPERRRWQRAVKHSPKEILVIRLRRTKPKHGDPVESGRTLTHRHIRDGHWRMQPYPSLGRSRQIWIAPTVVGDDSLPLIVKRRYYKWDR